MKKYLILQVALVVFSVALFSPARADLTPARDLTGTWDTPFPVPVVVTIDDGFGNISVSQAKMNVRWRIKARGNKAAIRSARVGAIRSFRILNDGGGDRATIALLAKTALNNLSVNTIFKGKVSSSRLKVSTLGGKPVGTFRFTSDLLGGTYDYRPTSDTRYQIKRLRMVRKRR
ncbi:MAG: hypothetical protein KDN18_00835 [Verrucomicrobiae bacterium]|nr:hypothetical protein [Verrucomicrobiae bacterium]